MEEYHTLINEIIKRYPGQLKLMGTGFENEISYDVTNALGSVLR